MASMWENVDEERFFSASALLVAEKCAELVVLLVGFMVPLWSPAIVATAADKGGCPNGLSTVIQRADSLSLTSRCQTTVLETPCGK